MVSLSGNFIAAPCKSIPALQALLYLNPLGNSFLSMNVCMWKCNSTDIYI